MCPTVAYVFLTSFSLVSHQCVAFSSFFVHMLLTLCSVCIQCVFTICSHISTICAVFGQDVFTVCSLICSCIFTTCRLGVRCVSFSIWSVLAHTSFTLYCLFDQYSPFIHYLFIFVHYLLTICSRCVHSLFITFYVCCSQCGRSLFAVCSCGHDVINVSSFSSTVVNHCVRAFRILGLI